MHFRRGAGLVAALLVSAGLATGCSSKTYRDINYGSDLGRGWTPEAGPLDADGGVVAGSGGASGSGGAGTGGVGSGGAGGSDGDGGDAGPVDGGDDAADALDNS